MTLERPRPIAIFPGSDAVNLGQNFFLGPNLRQFIAQSGQAHLFVHMLMIPLFLMGVFCAVLPQVSHVNLLFMAVSLDAWIQGKLAIYKSCE